MSEKKIEPSDKQPELTEVPCSFCGGAGTDPFGIMSWESKCVVCGGAGTVSICSPFTQCAHCEGTGAVKTFPCTACMGKGLVPLPPGPITTCPECRGSGDDDGNSGLPCLKCRGRGFVLLE